MAIERITDSQGALEPLRVTRKKERPGKDGGIISPSIRVRCACCSESVVIYHDSVPPKDPHHDTLEINDVIGTIDQWRKVLLPLLGIKNESKKNMKLRTIDEVCGQPPGSFKKSIQAQQEADRQTEEERKARIRAARQKPK